MVDQIPEADRVTYAEAEAMTGRSREYLAGRARSGELLRVSGRGGPGGSSFFSRKQIEILATRLGPSKPAEVAFDDRISYAEAAEISQRSHRYLLKLVDAGRLTRDGDGHPFKTFLSRREVEALALSEYQRGRTGRYWMTMTQVAQLTGIARANVHQARQVGHLIAHRTRTGDWLVRTTDAYGFLFARNRTVDTEAVARPGLRLTP